jgi:hypothetical protein
MSLSFQGSSERFLYMRRLISFTGIILLALLVSGWSSIFAASFCPHAAGKKAAAMMEGHSCGREGAEQSHHSESQRQAMDGMEMMPAAKDDGDGAFVPVGQLIGTCSHCLGQNDSPITAANARELNVQKRDAGAPVAESAIPLAPPVVFFSPKFIATQNAPPGGANRKHLLLGVFLI